MACLERGLKRRKGLINNSFQWFCFLLALLFYAGYVDALDVTLQWDTNEDAEYYVVYYGKESGNYTGESDKIYAPAVECTVKNLESVSWYFAVKAFNSCGNSSDFSDEVIYSSYYSPLSISIESPVLTVTINQGEAVNFQGLVSGGTAPLMYSWDFGAAGPSDRSVEDPGSVVFPDAGQYTVTFTVTDANGATEYQTVVVQVNAIYVDTHPTAEILSPALNVSLTVGGSIQFDGQVLYGNAPFVCSWDFGSAGMDDLSVEDPGTVAFNKAGVFTVTFAVTDKDGDTSSDTVTVTVNEQIIDLSPVASISSPGGNVTLSQGGAVAFQASVSSGDSPFVHHWNFGNSGIAEMSVEDPGSVTFASSGTFTVTYQVTDSDGDTHSATRTITVTPLASLPSQDTPDQENDSDVTTTGPGVKNTDSFVPPTESSVVESADGQPTIDVRDSQLRHLVWLKCGWAAYNSLNGESRIATGDIDGDGKDEVILGLSSENATPTTPGGFFQVLDDTYEPMGWGRIEWADYNESNGESWPDCGDVDGDGKDEIVVGLGKNGSGYMEIFGWAGHKVVHQSWLRLQWPDYNDINGEVRPVCADVNGDGKEDIIAGLGSMGGDPGIPGGKFEVFSKISGQWAHLLWGFVDWPEYAEINGETWPAAGDVDGDGLIELVIGLGKGGEGQMAVFEFSEGEALQSDWVQIEWPEYNDLYGETRPVCGDVDNDGKDEVILGWSTPSETTDSTHYLKVLSYQPTTGNWLNYKESKAAVTAEPESRPVKSSVDGNDRIYIGMGVEEDQSAPQSVKAVAGAGGGGSGCFIESVLN